MASAASSSPPVSVSTTTSRGPFSRPVPLMMRTPWLVSSSVIERLIRSSISATRCTSATPSTSASRGNRPMACARAAKERAPPVAIIVLEGMQSHRWAAPPTMSRSTRVTSPPRRAAWVATWLPAGPPPMITTRTGMGSARGLVDPEDVAQDVADLAQRRPAAERLLHRRQQVLRAGRRGPHVVEGGVDRGPVAPGTHAPHPVGLLPLQLRVDREHLLRLGLVLDVAV